jgi:hypothetical protein
MRLFLHESILACKFSILVDGPVENNPGKKDIPILLYMHTA